MPFYDPTVLSGVLLNPKFKSLGEDLKKNTSNIESLQRKRGLLVPHHHHIKIIVSKQRPTH